MHSRKVYYKGNEYKSICEVCKAYNVSYQRVRRLIRHYKNAQKDPCLAVDWCLNHSNLKREPKTIKYYLDLRKTAERQIRFKDRKISIIKSKFSL